MIFMIILKFALKKEDLYYKSKKNSHYKRK